jgi:hypothetical protein
MPNLDKIKAAERQEVRRQRPWPRITAFLHRWKRRAQAIAAFGTAIGTLFTMGAGAWRYIAARRLPAEAPLSKDGERLTIDRVEKPKQP